MESKEKIDHFLNNLLSEKEKLLYQKAVNGDPESQVCMCVLAENANMLSIGQEKHRNRDIHQLIESWG